MEITNLVQQSKDIFVCEIEVVKSNLDVVLVLEADVGEGGGRLGLDQVALSVLDEADEQGHGFGVLHDCLGLAVTVVAAHGTQLSHAAKGGQHVHLLVKKEN